MTISAEGHDFFVRLDGDKLSPWLHVEEVHRTLFGSGETDTAVLRLRPKLSATASAAFRKRDLLHAMWYPLFDRNVDFKSVLVGRKCEIFMKPVGEDALSGSKLVHVGVIGTDDRRRDQDGEFVSVSSKQEDELFGVPVTGRVTVKEIIHGTLPFKMSFPFSLFPISLDLGIPIDTAFMRDLRRPVTVGREIVFNPVVDGFTYPNRTAVKAGVPFVHGLDLYYFVDPEMIPRHILYSGFIPQTLPVVRLIQAAMMPWKLPDVFSRSTVLSSLRTAGVSWWSLEDAVQYLFNVLNPDELHFSNPKKSDILNVLNSTGLRGDDRLLQNEVIPAGTYLPDALSMLLNKFGVHAFIEYRDHWNTKPVIQLVNRSKPKLVKVPMQKIGEVVSHEKDRVPRVNISLDASNEVVNSVRLLGGYPKAEITIELQPGWDPYNTDVPYDDLTPSSDAWLADPMTYSALHREWIANEDGMAPAAWELDAPEVHRIFDVASLGVLTGWLPSQGLKKRRRPYPTVTATRDGDPIGPNNGFDIEYSLDDGDTWVNVASLEDTTVQVMEDRLGVRFDGALPPLELFRPFFENAQLDHVPGGGAAPRRAAPRVRLTCSIESDNIMDITVTDDGTILQQGYRELVIDRGDEFAFQYLHRRMFATLSMFANDKYESKYVKLRGVHLTPIARNPLFKYFAAYDDRRQMFELAKRVLNTYKHPHIHGSVTIHSLAWEPLKGSIFVGGGPGYHKDAAGPLGLGIEEFEGRGTKLGSRAKKSEAVFPLVTRVSYFPASQEQRWQLGTYRPEIDELI